MINNLDVVTPCLFLIAGPVPCSPSAVFWGEKTGTSLLSQCTAQGSPTDLSNFMYL